MKENNPVALLLLLLFATTGLALAPMLGGRGRDRRQPRRRGRERRARHDQVVRVRLPGVVGLRLDLARSLDPLFFLGFLAFACGAKLVSGFAGESSSGALNFAIAMNARGGPGIVLASVTYGAGIVNEGFSAVLVLLAIVTSCLAGSWLEVIVRKGWPLR